MFIFYFKHIMREWDYYYIDMETLYLTILKLGFTFVNVLCYAFSQITIAHNYGNMALFYVTFTLIFFAKLHQVDNILKRPIKSAIRFTQIAKFMHHHTNTFRQVMIANKLISALATMFMALNFPTNLYLMMFIFVLPDNRNHEKNFAIYLFCSMIVMAQLAGYLVIHVTSTMYTKKLHKHSKFMIQINMRQKFNFLGRSLKIAFYIEKFHTKKRYGYTYLNLGLITMKTFIQVKFVFRFKLNIIFIFLKFTVSVVLCQLYYDDLCFVSRHFKGTK